MVASILRSCGHLRRRAKQHLKQWTKPATAPLFTGAVSDLTRSRTDLIAKNVMLRQQLIVLMRQVKRPNSPTAIAFDWFSWLAAPSSGNRLSSSSNLTACCVGIPICFAAIGEANKGRGNCVSPLRRSPSSGRWPRKTGCGAHAHPRRVAEAMGSGQQADDSEVSAQGASRFEPDLGHLMNRAGDISGCDFTVIDDLLFRPWLIFVVIELEARRIVHTAVTRSPTDDWTAQQLRKAMPWGEGEGSKYLIRDRDDK